MDVLVRYIRTLPEALQQRYTVKPPGPRVVVYSGTFTIRQGKHRASLRGRIVLHWKPGPEVRFSGIAGLREPQLELKSGDLRTDSSGIRGDVVNRTDKCRTTEGGALWPTIDFYIIKPKGLQ